ncbi:GntR family transcriptional regulator [Sabulicella glaciei]|uniref:GntR family transcriptional regulator n=1 Tax=Sabulicella glaciei TaxID=2984948 RepID=A0ABT3NR14_9PROT|nr:GntR family transcriptional regulator [Roseococcus sp. MDT2-1-1]MCW8084605.1 GntR family transcriptional regulator [Roseococcus sp. MDT2-1-1]
MSGPLYARAEAALRARIAAGEWKPGKALPTEPALAGELGISQGTLRRALATLERARVIERRQGVGTFVAEATSERALFHFFRVERLDGTRPVPTSRVLSLTRRRASEAERRALGLAAGAAVLFMERERLVDGEPAILERVAIPAAFFPGLTLPIGVELKDELYVLYQRGFGLTVTRVEEWLAATPAPAGGSMPEGTPVLNVARLAFELGGRAVEWRLSWLDTRRLRYAVTLA